MESRAAGRSLAPEVVQFLAIQKSNSIPADALVDAAASATYLRQLRGPRAALARPAEIVAYVEDLHVGRHATGVRLYRPSEEEPAPVIIFLHGGGWVTGSLDTHDALSRRLANATGCLVLSVDYRLAPEHRYPAGLDDVAAVLEWTHSSIGDRGGDPKRIALAGTSAGGNLAAAAALRARDSGGPEVSLQVLLYPVIDSEMTGASYVENARGYSLETPLMEWFWDQYIPDAAMRTDPYASPRHAADLRGLPPAIIMTTELDPLRDEGEAYAARLRESDVPVTSFCVDGQIHGLLSFVGAWADADAAMKEVAGGIRRRFAMPDSGTGNG